MNETTFTKQEIEDFVNEFNETNMCPYFEINHSLNNKNNNLNYQLVITVKNLPNIEIYYLKALKKRTGGYFLTISSGKGYFSSTYDLKKAVKILYKMNEKYLSRHCPNAFKLMKTTESIRNF